MPDPISKAINENDLVATSVLSGNRNFEGRISPDVKANYLASPPLVVAYAIAGTVDIDLQNGVIGKSADGKDVCLKDIWPTQQEVNDVVASCVTREQFETQYADVFKGSQEWQDVKSSTGALYEWDAKSTYVQEPPFFVGLTSEVKPISPITGARCLAKLGDSVTTDHISPAGSIKTDSPAGKYLTDNGVPKSLFNSYGSRRGNDRVMTRGTFANIPCEEPARPRHRRWLHHRLHDRQGPARSTMQALTIRRRARPLVVLAGIDYGMGSSRDCGRKGHVPAGREGGDRIKLRTHPPI